MQRGAQAQASAAGGALRRALSEMLMRTSADARADA